MSWFTMLFTVTITYFVCADPTCQTYTKHTDEICIEAEDRESALNRVHLLYLDTDVTSLNVGLSACMRTIKYFDEREICQDFDY